MNKEAYIYLFPGQGSQYSKMGLYHYKNHEIIKRTIEEASDILQFNFSRLIFNGTEQALKQTINTQPAITVINAAYFHLLSSLGIAPIAVAGHSVGELTAYYAAGIYNFETLLSIVSLRAHLMQQASEICIGGMLAVMGLNYETVASLINKTKLGISIATINAEKQIILSGQSMLLKDFSYICIKEGASRTLLLNVGGAWHSHLMSPITKPFADYLDKITFSDAKLPVYCNSSADATTDGSLLKRNLIKQMNSTVLWSLIMKHMINDFPKASFIEVGPNKILKGLLLQIDNKKHCIQLDAETALKQLQLERAI
jgi:[acyl-carrier-protein] S-malonyltransferase